jgi:lipopolysaccharide/colanic/teichoic acid biosynthesis glycosyltransferase
VADLAFATVLIVVLAPLFAIVAAVVRARLGRPVLYCDERAGMNAQPIRVMKFRSMKELYEPDGRPAADAVRLTSLGRFLRRTSLDELPQLFSVLKGDMSLVGPRPLPMRYVARYSPRQSLRLTVRPGLTGWAQIHGRNAVDWPKRLEYDVQYVEYLGRWWAPFLDLWIVMATAVQVVATGLTGRGIAARGTATMKEFQP